MGWYFIMSSPEPKLNIVTKDEDNNKKLNLYSSAGTTADIDL
jgi:hypothetical protein